jgi:hypothetical protein
MYQHEIGEQRPQSRVVRIRYPVEAEGPQFQFAQRRYLEARSLNADLAAENGWYPSLEAGDDILRTVIPATNSADFPYWQARALVQTSALRYRSPAIPRHDSIVIVWPKGRKTPRPGRAVVVEGPLDALAVAELGLAGVGLMGAQPPEAVYAHIARLFGTVLVIPDDDFRSAAARHVRELNYCGCNAWFRYLPERAEGHARPKDLADLTVAERERLVSEL